MPGRRQNRNPTPVSSEATSAPSMVCTKTDEKSADEDEKPVKASGSSARPPRIRFNANQYQPPSSGPLRIMPIQTLLAANTSANNKALTPTIGQKSLITRSHARPRQPAMSRV